MAIYALSVVTVFRYVNLVLKNDVLNVMEQQTTKKAVTIKPVKVTLNVELPQITLTYNLNMKNTDSVLDFLNELRRTTNFRYQKTSYVDRNEIDYINGIYPQDGFKWRIYSNEKDLTQTFEDTHLENNTTYVIKLIKEN